MIKIKPRKSGDEEVTGYALVNELSEKIFSFFCTEKFSIDEELEVRMSFSGHDLTYRVQLSHLHEQISSGRIMNTLPSEDNPFPARKFYRCFSKVLELKGMEPTGTNDSTIETGAPQETKSADAPEMDPAPVDSETKAA